MSDAIIPPEVKAILEDNRYIDRVTRKSVFFKYEFKVLFCNGLAVGQTAEDIIASVGIDPGILGESRIMGMVNNFPKQVNLESEAFLKDRSYIEPKYIAMKKIDQLEHEVQYLRQEQEFIKKILTAKPK